MAICCADIHKLVHPYIDGEFSEEDRAEFERHVSECEPCRTAVDAEKTFKDKLRAKLALPKPGADLRARIAMSLDEVDGTENERPSLLAWLVPSSAMATAAAAIALFFLYPSARTATPPAAMATADSIRTNDLFIDRVASDPVEVSVKNVRPEARRHTGISVQLLQAQNAEPTRAWVTQLVADRRAVRVDYRIRNRPDDDARTLHMFSFDPRGLTVNAKSRRRINGTDVLCASGKGMNRVYYTKNGIGFALVSDLDEASLLDIVRSELAQP